MDEQKEQKKQPLYRYEPGELDKTRKNIGEIDKEEAAKMTKILGGEIGLEKSAPVDENALKKVRTARMMRTGERRTPRYREPPVVQKTENTTKEPETEEKVQTTPKQKKESLPVISTKERAKIEKLMMSPDYRIKQNLGFFNFFSTLTKSGQEKVSPIFVSITLKAYLLRIQNFQTRVVEFQKLVPESFQKKIDSDDDLKFKFVKVVSGWNTLEIESKYQELDKHANNLTITMMIPFIRSVYKLLLTLYYLGENRVAEILQNLLAELNQYADAKKDKIQVVLRDISTEWSYVYNRVIKGLYPLLLRMCSQEYMDCHTFFIKQLPKIFNFVGITKFDILLPQKKQSPAALQIQEQEKQEEKNEALRQQEQKEMELINSSLRILDRIFPGAGWLELDSLPDMYPFYQPLYNFPDGLNLVAPENPLQIIIILIKIIEDLLEGCRNIGFSDEQVKEEAKGTVAGDTLMQIMNDWSAYRETVFDKLYVPYLKEYVNKLYSQKEFPHTQYGKRLISNMQWHTFYNYLPHMKFEQLLLEKPTNESKMRPLSLRTELLVKELRRITVAADVAAKNNTQLQEIPTMFNSYTFDIPNVVSNRLDVLLGAKRNKEGGRANNLNLLKYTLAAVSVLNWFTGNKNSPAYQVTNVPMCRLSEEDGSPIFSVQGRTDQHSLFVQSIKAAAQKTTAST
ncbi:MAG: hypothetical protein E7063_03385 [Spirochaetaceae bacterium]|nr:hypothetical protein [Spirochaetaceae bacterium]